MDSHVKEIHRHQDTRQYMEEGVCLVPWYEALVEGAVVAQASWRPRVTEVA